MSKKGYTSHSGKLSLLFVFLLFALGSALILVVSTIIFKNNTVKEPEAIVTDGQFNKAEKIAYFQGQKVNAPTEPWTGLITGQKVLSAESDDSKWVEVDLTNQRVRAWNGNHLDYEFPASTGKRQWGTATPTGSYRIWIKLRSTLMQGGSGSTYYYLPNVQCTQYFNKGFGLHGTYWHNNFGHPMSHGCVNLRTEDACTLFYWTSPSIDTDQTMVRPSNESQGTRVVVHGETPWE